MTPKELIREAIPLVRESWYQSSSGDRGSMRAQGNYCPILAMDKIVGQISGWRTRGIEDGINWEEILNQAIDLMNKAAGEAIAEFNDRQESVGSVIAVMEKAAA